MFSWSSGNGNKEPSGQYPGRRIKRDSNIHTPVEGSIRPSGSGYTRAQHLKSYVDDSTLQRSTRRVSADDTTYDTVFQTTRGDTLILRVNIPYGSVLPAMTLAGIRVIHPWIEPERMRVTGYRHIQSESTWQSSNILLGTAVHDVVKYLQLNPPEIVEIIDRGLSSLNAGRTKHHHHSSSSKSKSPKRKPVNERQNDAPPDYDIFVAGSNTNGSSNNNNNTNNNPRNFGPPPDVPMPTVPSRFPEIDVMDREEVDEKLDDDVAFLAFVHGLPIFEEIQKSSTGNYTKNVQLADENLKRETELKELHQQVCDLHQQLQGKMTTFRKLEQEQNDLCAPPDRNSALRQLKRANKEAFEASEDYANEWVEDGSLSVDDFVKEFLQLRQVHHVRAAKMEVLSNKKAAI